MTQRIQILHDRSEMLFRSREFFRLRGVREVDCPMLSASASVDAHIDLIPCFPYSGKRFLHSSPEYGMKRLLSEGIGDIFQLSHVFRDGEEGQKHNPEFMMAEWYRLGFAFTELIEETFDFIRLFLGQLPAKIITYREAFLKYAGFDYVKLTPKEILNEIVNLKIPHYDDIHNENKDGLLNLILGSVIEPQLGEKELCALAFYPSSQAALAQIQIKDDEEVCERFEVYYKGVELANGYHELADPIEQRKRLEDANIHRQALNKESLPIDENFLKSLMLGLPDCCGVAVGFDRLMMLRWNCLQIQQILPHFWQNA